MGYLQSFLFDLLLTVFSSSLAVGCGSRSELLIGEPCATEGDTRNCSNTCGTGSQLCEDGYWQTCEVPVTELSCENQCGKGLAICENNTLGECVVEPTSESCTDACGTGTRVCRDNTWTGCEVAPVEQACSNDCGDGILTCENGTWGTCEVPTVEIACTSVCGTGTKVCENGTWGGCSAPQPLPPKLDALVRDFKIEHPDFERTDLIGSYHDVGIVENELGSDDLPVYAQVGATDTVTSEATFDQWYRDVAGVNLSTNIEIQLATSSTTSGMFEYANTSFFPIDNQLWGNEGLSHNYHFTLMVATRFVYVGGETFSFEGDDDMWVFINRKLAIDLGGIHEAQYAEVVLDTWADYLGIQPGNSYSLHFFFAERKTIASDFTIRTTIADIGSCP